jgi:glycerol-3-phosphate O-acyltransferase
MGKLLKTFFLNALILLKPLLGRTLLRNRAKIASYREAESRTNASGMVTEFNLADKLIYQRFFKRVRTVRTDITSVKTLSHEGPVVYVMKNRGQLEYRFFNHLFLREKIDPVRYANGCLTVLWRPLAQVWRYSLARLDEFYDGAFDPGHPEDERIASLVANGKNVLINLSVSRDYLFGLFNTNPLAKIGPLVELQRKTAAPIRIVPLQFLYDKQPEKAEKSFFDFLFGEKSRPGALRKVILFVMSLRKTPQAKFGSPIDLKAFLSENASATDEGLVKSLYGRIEETLAIEHARITGPKLKSKEALVHDILRDPAFVGALQETARETGETFESLKIRARGYLHEIAADVNYSYVHFAWLALNYLWNNIFDGVVVKHDQLNRVREIAGKHPIVLVPMHRSHIDYLLVTHIFYANNITFPHICAGINMNFWPIGRLVRKCGGFFIRRRFEGNRAYKESLYAYVKLLVNQGYCIEFFIEGTRSRTGKMLKPKLGILGQIVRAWHEGRQDDVHFIPIAVNYDQLIEQKSYESEGTGAEKKKEHAGELIKAGKVLGKKYGKVYVEFAEPISLKEYLSNKGVSKASPSEDLRREVGDFGYHLTYNMNRVAVVTPMALVALAVLSLGKKTFGFEELIATIGRLKSYLDAKDVTYSDLIHYSDRWAYGEAVQLLQSRGLIREVKTFEENFYALEPSQRAALDYYKNNILHFFVSMTCFCKIVSLADANAPTPLAQAVKKYEVLKRIFKNDFTFSARASVEEHLLRVMRYCESRGFIRSEDGLATFTPTVTDANRAEFTLFACLLDNFLESHWVALRYLRHNRFENADSKTIVKDILEKSKPLYLKDDLRHPEALNRFNLENALKTCADIGLVGVVNDKGKTLYTRLNEPEMAEKWLKSVAGFLHAPRPAIPHAVLQPIEKTGEFGTGLH